MHKRKDSFEFLGNTARDIAGEVDRLRNQRNALLALCKNALPALPLSCDVRRSITLGIARVEADL